MKGFRNERPVFGFRWIAKHGGLEFVDAKKPWLGTRFVLAPDTQWHLAGKPYDWKHLKSASVEARRAAVSAYARRPWQYA